MPWKILKRPCKKSDGKTGTYVIVKIKRGGGTEQSSCHTSKKKAQGGVRARHANEGKMKITRTQLRSIIKEEKQKLQEQTRGPSEAQIEDAVSGIERELNRLYDLGMDNAGLHEVLDQIKIDIDRGFVGEPT